MPNPFPSREDDEQILMLIHWRAKGHTTPAIGKHLGIPCSRVRVATNAVKTADAASGEDITGAYW